MTYEKLYGVSLDEYCKYHNINPERLVQKTKKDIELLKRNLHKHTYEIEPTNWNLVSQIHKLLNKKIKHLERLKEWIKTKSNNKDNRTNQNKRIQNDLFKN